MTAVRVRAVVASGVVASIFLAACSGSSQPDDGGSTDSADDDDGDGGDGGDDGGDDGGPGVFAIRAERPRLLVRQGATEMVQIRVQREGNFADPIIATLEPLPDGITADPVTIAAGENAASMTVSAAADATQGAAALEVIGTAGDITDRARLRLLVAGPPGTLDESFADAGRFTVQVDDLPTFGRGHCLQPDGNIILSGTSQSQAITIRLDAAGTVDDTFGTSGIVSTPLGPSSGGTTCAALEDARIIVAGHGGETDPDPALFAYTEGGAPDEAFGPAGNGTVTADLGTGSAEIRQLMINSAGDILAIAALVADPPITQLLRYTSAGTRDETFSDPILGAAAQTARIDADARILIAGTMDGDYWLTRLTPTGDVDTSFADDGTATFDFEGGTDTAHAIIIAPSGNLALIGVTDQAGDRRLSMARLTPTGAPDPDFGTNGTRLTNIPFDTRAPSAALLDQSNLVIAGHIPDRPTPHLAIYRLNPNLTPDDTFGTNGRTVIDFDTTPSPTNTAHALTIDPDHRILVSGEIGPTEDAEAAMIRLWP